MNAKWMPAIGAAAGAIGIGLCLLATAGAAPRSNGGSTHPPAVLTRGDVDRLLDEARQAIAEGNLDRAEALVARAESAQVRYPLFHLGPTPGSVRRELIDAQNSARYRQRTQSPGAVEVAPAQYAAPTTDPFAERPINGPSGPTSQPLPPNLAADMEPVVPAVYSHPMGEPDRDVLPASALPEAPLPPGLLAAGDGGNPWSSLPADTNHPSGENAAPDAPAKARALELLRDARSALSAGNLEQAEAAAQQAAALGVPESAFLPHEERPSMVMWDIRRARDAQPASPSPSNDTRRDALHAAATAGLDPSSDTSRTIQTAAEPLALSDLRFAQAPEPIELPPEGATPITEELPSPAAKASPRPQIVADAAPAAKPTNPPREQSLTTPQPRPAQSEAERLLTEGEQALAERDRRTAARLFGQAYVLRDQLSDEQQATLETYLKRLADASAATQTRPSGQASSLLDEAVETDQALARQMSAAVGKTQSDARRMRESDPREALKLLQEQRQKIADSQLSDEYRNQLFRRIDITIDETERYLKDHAAEIELDEKNKAVLAEVDRNREVKLKVQQKIAELVDEFNRLRDEQRYAEMEVVARRLIEMAPDEPVAQQVWQNAKFIRRTINNQQLVDRRDDANWDALNDVETAAIQNVFDGRELVYDQKHWDLLVKKRTGSDRETRRTERELEIERRLKTPVLLRYENTPLSEVMQGLSELTGVNIHLDPRGLSQEGIETSTPVTINLSKEISLKSALNLILEPLHLSYVVTDEVLKITSEQLRDGEIYSKVYSVADLVIPIPNFVPNNNIGLQGLINDAIQTVGYGQGGLGMPGPTVLVNNDRGPDGQPVPNNQNVLAQQFGAAGSGAAGGSVPIGTGPGGLGGGANADFDSLIDLIVSTIATETWAENGGGEAEIRPFPTNLSLVISQTQAVHEEIADLLEQLRRLQDLQVTIEVRFIRLNDRFFERIGIDFDMNIEDRTSGTAGLTPGNPFEPTVNGRPTSTVVGLQFPVPPTAPFPNFTSDLDVPFRQESFDLAVPPPFSAPAQVGSFGFAILSEIEAYFLIQAAQGDTRTNILNAPKVTLFNGQQAFVADAISRPFVIGVIPVVGEFAAAQQPVIVVLNEGTMMSIQAVVSNDRRYVRLTVVPFFTQVGNVDTFTFEGTRSSSSSSSSSSSDNNNGQSEAEEEDESEVISGVTVQLPSFQFVAVVTTVSVPDGGTVLLGGIKRLSEGRNEFGLPLLSKVPYINRLFRNVGIGRSTDSLMMMVTPRIIIQEEEEERLGISAVP